jgi:hypothetical protein
MRFLQVIPTWRNERCGKLRGSSCERVAPGPCVIRVDQASLNDCSAGRDSTRRRLIQPPTPEHTTPAAMPAGTSHGLKSM